ncbi:myb-like DNA-binding domain protein [Trifolium medium]|uniref:Myb-like DNA-binding domain protein n=1 Tax=Trifolium medium TaxID=97028 RepID=A0A392M192_9FABA|nr:myb-like DNA-binding domain protein [Trifolium medium]
MAISSGTGNHQEQHAHGNSVPESSSGLVVNMKHDPGIYWTPEEQATLEDLLTKYASISNIILRYAAIAPALNDKIVKDVARRVRWMNLYCTTDFDESTMKTVMPSHFLYKSDS